MASQASSSQTISLQPHQQQLHQPVGFKEPLLYKNRLQEFAQREKIEMPVYQTQNEGGTQHAPRYKSTVVVDGKTFTSSATFSNRKAAEQDAAKMALECISNTRKGSVSNKTSDEGFPPISEDRVFCKSILYEFAVKTNSEMPTYNTVQLEGLLPMFVCSVVFNGVTYTGDSSVNKKEAEQLAARAVILSILGNSGSGTILSDIIKAKATLYSTVHKRSCSSDRGVFPVASNSEVCLERASTVGNVIGNAASDALQGQSPVPLQRQSPVPLQGQSPVSLQGLSHVVARHEFKKPGTEEVSQAIELPITFVPSLQVQSSPNEFACGGKRKRKNKKKAKKKAKTEIPSYASEAPTVELQDTHIFQGGADPQVQEDGFGPSPSCEKVAEDAKNPSTAQDLLEKMGLKLVDPMGKDIDAGKVLGEPMVYGRARKGLRELKNLQSNINYEGGGLKKGFLYWA